MRLNKFKRGAQAMLNVILMRMDARHGFPTVGEVLSPFIAFRELSEAHDQLPAAKRMIAALDGLTRTRSRVRLRVKLRGATQSEVDRDSAASGEPVLADVHTSIVAMLAMLKSASLPQVAETVRVIDPGTAEQLLLARRHAIEAMTDVKLTLAFLLELDDEDVEREFRLPTPDVEPGPSSDCTWD